MSDVYNTTDWETVSFKVHTKTFHAPKFKFIHARMCLGRENSVLKALEQMTSTTSYPIRVDESITEGDFESLLSLLYPSCGLSYVDTPLKDLWTKDQWISVLKISSLWFYQDLRSLALNHLDAESLSPTELNSLSRAYSVPEWVNEGLCVLGHSHSLIDAELFDALGHLTALRVYQIRERKEFPEARANQDNGTFVVEYRGVEDDVRRVFCGELDELEKVFQEYSAIPTGPLDPPQAASFSQPSTDTPKHNTSVTAHSSSSSSRMTPTPLPSAPESLNPKEEPCGDTSFPLSESTVPPPVPSPSSPSPTKPVSQSQPSSKHTDQFAPVLTPATSSPSPALSSSLTQDASPSVQLLPSDNRQDSVRSLAPAASMVKARNAPRTITEAVQMSSSPKPLSRQEKKTMYRARELARALQEAVFFLDYLTNSVLSQLFTYLITILPTQRPDLSLLSFILVALAVSTHLVHAKVVTEEDFLGLTGQFTAGWSAGATDVPDLWVRYGGKEAWQNTAEPGSPYVFSLDERAGYRIEDDEETEVVVQDLGEGIDGIKFHTERTSGTDYYADAIYTADIHLTYIPSESAKDGTGTHRRRDLFDEGNLEPLPFTTRTLVFRNDMEFDGCAEELQLTAVTTDAQGQATTYTGVNNITLDIPSTYPYNVRLTHDQDEAYFTTFNFTDVTYQWAKGSSAQIGDIAVNEEIRLLICGDQN